VDDIADMLLTQIAMIATGEAEVADLALTEESEWESLPFRGPEIAAAHALFTPEDDTDEPRDIMKIIAPCLKVAKRCKIRCAFKMIT
jgi:hypothetical protein